MLGRIRRCWVESRPGPCAGLSGVDQTCTFSVWSCLVLPGCLQFPGAPPPLGTGPGHQAGSGLVPPQYRTGHKGVAEGLMTQPGLLLLGHLQRQRGARAVVLPYHHPHVHPILGPVWGSSRLAGQLVWGRAILPDSSPNSAQCPQSLPGARPGWPRPGGQLPCYALGRV